MYNGTPERGIYVLNTKYIKMFHWKQVCSLEKSFLAYSEFISTTGIWKTVK